MFPAMTSNSFEGTAATWRWAPPSAARLKWPGALCAIATALRLVLRPSLQPSVLALG